MKKLFFLHVSKKVYSTKNITRNIPFSHHVSHFVASFCLQNKIRGQHRCLLPVVNTLQPQNHKDQLYHSTLHSCSNTVLQPCSRCFRGTQSQKHAKKEKLTMNVVPESFSHLKFLNLEAFAQTCIKVAFLYKLSKLRFASFISIILLFSTWKF